MAYAGSKGGRWIGRYKTPDGRKKVYAPRGVKWTKGEAKAEAWRLERAAMGGELPRAEAERLPLADLCRWWLTSWCPEASQRREKSRLKVNVIEQPIGALPLKAVTPEKVEELLRQMEAAGAATSSVEHVRRTLRRVFNRAIRSGTWNKNPAAQATSRSMKSVRKYRTLSDEEIAILLAHIPERWKRNIVAFAVATGMRKGELLALRKSDLDLEAGAVTVQRSHGRDTTKGGHQDTIPINATLRPYVVDAFTAAGTSELVFPDDDGARRADSTKTERIVQTALKAAGLVEAWEHVCRRCKSRGTPYAERRKDRQWDLECPTCGMKLWPKAVRWNFTFHDLRHTTATLLLRAGVDPHRVQRILRHKDLRTTLGTYAHLLTEDLRPAMEKLPALPPPPDVIDAEMVEVLEQPAALAAGRGPSVAPNALMVKEEGPELQAKTPEDSGPSDGARYWIRTSGLRLRRAPQSLGTEQQDKASQRIPSDRLPVGGDPNEHRIAPFGVLRGPSVAPPLLTVGDVAKRLRVCTALVYRVCGRGELSHVRVGGAIRVAPEDLEAFIARGKGC